MKRFARLCLAVLTVAGSAACSADSGEQPLTGPTSLKLSTAAATAAVTDTTAMSSTCRYYVRTRDALKTELAANPSDTEATEGVALWDKVIAGECQ
jgi:hypothetical protein